MIVQGRPVNAKRGYKVQERKQTVVTEKEKESGRRSKTMRVLGLKKLILNDEKSKMKEQRPTTATKTVYDKKTFRKK